MKHLKIVIGGILGLGVVKLISQYNKTNNSQNNVQDNSNFGIWYSAGYDGGVTFRYRIAKSILNNNLVEIYYHTNSGGGHTVLSINGQKELTVNHKYTVKIEKQAIGWKVIFPSFAYNIK